MRTETAFRQGLKAVLCASASAMVLSAAAFAQDPAPAATASAEEEVVVTGTRIKNRDFVSNSPIQTVSGAQLARTGEINLENVMNSLPQIVPGATAASNNPGGGVATVDLRGLGPSRTLVLVEGRRIVPYDTTGIVDLNSIPSEMVDRVEVVTGGASAVYGSDALGGVVNFILKRNVEGFHINGSYGISSEGDGDEAYVGAVFGVKTDKGGSIMFHAGYLNREGVLNSERDYTRLDFTGLADYNTIFGLPAQGGSSRGTASIVNNPGNATPAQPTGLVLADGSACDALVSGGSRRRIVPTAAGVRGFCNFMDAFGGDRYNFAPVNYFNIPQERYTLAATGELPINMLGDAEVYFETFYTNSQTKNQLAPSPLAATELVSISVFNPTLSGPAQAALFGRLNPFAPAILERRMVEFGPRINDFESSVFQMTAGLKGSLGGTWTYDAYLQYGRVRFDSEIENDLSTSRLQAAINQCPLGSPAGCVPVNMFTAGGISNAAVNFIRISKLTDTTVFERQMASFTASGDVGSTDAGPISVALGAEYRRDRSDYRPDQFKVIDDIVGFNAAQRVQGEFDVYEFYGEAALPLISQGFVHYFGLEAGVRYSSYSTNANTWTYKVGAEFAPVEGYKLRGMYQRAVRAPSVFELFQTPAQNFPVVFDPCDTRFFSGALATENRCNGITPLIGANGLLIGGVDPNTFFASNVQIEETQIGGPNLSPETSDTFTIGVVINPPEMKEFSLTVDYYNIEVRDYVSRLFGGSQNAANACYNNGLAAACALLRRGPSGDLIVGNAPTGVGIGLDNSAQLQTSGLDVAASYTVGLMEIIGLEGSLTVDVNATYLIDYVYSQPFSGTGNAAGTYSFDFGNYPKLRGNLNFLYDNGPFQFSWRMRYRGPVTNVGGLLDPTDDGFYFIDTAGPARVDAFTYHDVYVSYAISDMVSMNLVVENLFNKEPPFLADVAVQNNTDPSNYDIMGRYFRVGLRANF